MLHFCLFMHSFCFLVHPFLCRFIWVSYLPFNSTYLFLCFILSLSLHASFCLSCPCLRLLSHFCLELICIYCIGFNASRLSFCLVSLFPFASIFIYVSFFFDSSFLSLCQFCLLMLHWTFYLAFSLSASFCILMHSSISLCLFVVFCMYIYA